MNAKQFLKSKGLKDTLYNVKRDDGSWIKGGLSKLLHEYNELVEPAAIPFGDWLNKNAYPAYNDSGAGDGWHLHQAMSGGIYTTEELFKIFKQ